MVPHADCGVISVTTQCPWFSQDTVCCSMLLSEYAQPPIEPSPSTTAAPAPGGQPLPGRESSIFEAGAGVWATAPAAVTSVASTTAARAARRPIDPRSIVVSSPGAVTGGIPSTRAGRCEPG